MSKGLIINEDVWELIEDLLPKEQNELLKLLAAYHRGEEIPPVSKMVKPTFNRIVLDNGRFSEDRRNNLSEIRRQAALKRWHGDDANGVQNECKEYANNANDANNANCTRIEEIRKEEIRIDKNRDVGRFAPPTTEEVEAYIKEKGYTMDAQRFVDFYSSKGWMVGKTKMRDWRAAARGWASREREKPRPKDPSFGRKVDYDALINQMQYGGES